MWNEIDCIFTTRLAHLNAILRLRAGRLCIWLPRSSLFVLCKGRGHSSVESYLLLRTMGRPCWRVGTEGADVQLHCRAELSSYPERAYKTVPHEVSYRE